MSRLQKQTVDYFPHYADADDGKTLTILQAKYGDTGYAVWFRLLQCLAKSDGHYITCSLDVDWQYLTTRLRIDKEKAKCILDDLVELGGIDRQLWEGSNIIWSDNFVRNIADVYRNRKRVLPSKPIINNISTTTLLLNNTQSTNILPTQSKVKESKVKESKVVLSSEPLRVSDTSISLTNKLISLMKSNNPKVKIPSDLSKWHLDIDRMIKLDKRTENEIEDVISFSQKDKFWKSNILSCGKLREKYDTLYLQMRSNGYGENNGQYGINRTNIKEVAGNEPAGAFAKYEERDKDMSNLPQ